MVNIRYISEAYSECPCVTSLINCQGKLNYNSGFQNDPKPTAWASLENLLQMQILSQLTPDYCFSFPSLYNKLPQIQQLKAIYMYYFHSFHGLGGRESLACSGSYGAKIKGCLGIPSHLKLGFLFQGHCLLREFSSLQL